MTPETTHGYSSTSEPFGVKSGELDEAITAWSKVRHDDDETYAWAQFNLGLA